MFASCSEGSKAWGQGFTVKFDSSKSNSCLSSLIMDTLTEGYFSYCFAQVVFHFEFTKMQLHKIYFQLPCEIKWYLWKCFMNLNLFRKTSMNPNIKPLPMILWCPRRLFTIKCFDSSNVKKYEKERERERLLREREII